MLIITNQFKLHNNIYAYVYIYVCIKLIYFLTKTKLITIFALINNYCNWTI